MNRLQEEYVRNKNFNGSIMFPKYKYTGSELLIYKPHIYIPPTEEVEFTEYSLRLLFDSCYTMPLNFENPYQE